MALDGVLEAMAPRGQPVMSLALALSSNVVSLALALASEVKSISFEVKPLILILLALCTLFFMLIGLVL